MLHFLLMIAEVLPIDSERAVTTVATSSKCVQ